MSNRRPGSRRAIKERAYRLAAEFLASDLAAGAILSEDETEAGLLLRALNEIINGLMLRAERLR